MRDLRLRLLIPLILLSLIGSTTASSAPHTVTLTMLQPTDFVRSTTAPDVVEAVFPGVAGTAFVEITNGDAAGNARVSAAVLTLNGTRIIAPRSFNQQVSTVRLPVTLSLWNTLQVELRGSPGGHLTVTVTQTLEAEAARIIGPDGGVVAVEDPTSDAFGVSLEIPPGAVARPVPISIQAADAGEFLQLDRDVWDWATTKTFRLLPEGLTFARPVALRVALPDSDLDGIVDGTSLPLVTGRLCWKTATSSVLNLAETGLDVQNHEAVTSTTHFSVWSLLFSRPSQKTVTYYVQGPPSADLPPGFTSEGYLEAIRKDVRAAFDAWSAALDQKVVFAEKDDAGKDDAVIQISFAPLCGTLTPWHAYYNPFTQNITFTTTVDQFGTCAPAYWIPSPYSSYTQTLSNKAPFLSTFLHESGHSLGVSDPSNSAWWPCNPERENWVPGGVLMYYNCQDSKRAWTTLSEFDRAAVRRAQGLPERTAGKMVALWAFDETSGELVYPSDNYSDPLGKVVRDSSGFGNHARSKNAGIVPGYKGNARAFSDSAGWWDTGGGMPVVDNVAFNSSLALGRVTEDNGATSDPTITVEAFVKVDDHGGARTIAESGRFRLGISADGHLRVKIGFSDWWKSADTIPTGRWVHVAGTWDSTTVKLYIDYELQRSAAWSGLPLGMTTWVLGANLDSGIPDAALDQVRITRAALAPDQFQDAPVSEVRVTFLEQGQWRTIDESGNVLTSIALPTNVGYADLSPNGERLVYSLSTTGWDATLWSYDLSTRENRKLLAAPWIGSIRWLPNSNSDLLFTHADQSYGCGGGSIYTYSVDTGSSSVWQDKGTLAGSFGVNTFDLVSWDERFQSSQSSGRFLVSAHFGCAGGEGVFVGDYRNDSIHHIANLRALANPANGSSSWATVTAAPELSSDGNWAYYYARTNWANFRVMRQNVSQPFSSAETIYRSATDGSALSLLNDDTLFVTDGRSILKCELTQSPVSCSPIYVSSVSNVWALRVRR